MSAEGLYFYAVSRGLTPEHVAGETGIHGAPLRLVAHEGLVAVVSTVGLDEFGEQGLEKHLEDLAWLQEVATAHDRVARAAAQNAPTAPLRLATVFLSEDSLRARISEWHDSASAALDRIEGRSEWSVKAYVAPEARPAEDEQPATSEEGVGAGRAYLLKRRAATQRKEDQAREHAELADRMHARLEEAAVLARRLTPQDPRLTGHTGEMVLNGAYLVGNDDVAAFKDVLDKVAGEHPGVRVELGGPWPPYSFASLDPS